MSTEVIFKQVETQMEQAVAHGLQTLQRLRAGRATPDMLSHLRIDYHGTPTLLPQVATIISPDARSLHIKPWEKAFIPEIENVIQQSDLGLTPQNNGETIILHIPPLSEERRKQVLKQAKQTAEKIRIRIRSVRKEGNESLKKDADLSEDQTKQAIEQVQHLTNKFIAQLDDILRVKEQEIMTI